MFSKKVWTNVRGYEDWDYWLASAAAGFSGKFIKKPIFFYRVKGNGVFSDTRGHDKAPANDNQR